MGVPDRTLMTADAFLDWVMTQDDAHELVDGRPVRMMTGARQSHNVVTSNILVALAPAAKRGGCRTTANDTAVRTGPNGVRYPDVVVDCGPPDAAAREARTPVLVVEVASPGTSALDVTDKLDEYRAHPSIRLIVLVDPDVVSVRVYRRGAEGAFALEKYEALTDAIACTEVGTDLALRDIYDTLAPKERPRLSLVEPRAGD